MNVGDYAVTRPGVTAMPEGMLVKVVDTSVTGGILYCRAQQPGGTHNPFRDDGLWPCSGAELEPVDTPNESILVEAEGLVNGPRRAEYGPAEDGFAKYAAGWSLIIGAPVTATQVALCMAWLKIMRETVGHKRDSLVDAAGYMHLAHLCSEAADES